MKLVCFLVYKLVDVGMLMGYPKLRVDVLVMGMVPCERVPERVLVELVMVFGRQKLRK